MWKLESIKVSTVELSEVEVGHHHLFEAHTAG